ncbi:hypothetical protein MASR2M41_16860 [Flammeovirgaceae bacterium]
MINLIKKILRPIYYLLFHNKIVIISSPAELAGFKWIIDKRFDRAYYKGYYEPKITQYLITNVNSGDCLIDVGAHAGYFSYLFSRLSPNGRILSFEPNVQNVDYIKKIIATNSVVNIELIPKALSSQTEKLSFSPGPTSSTGRVSKSGNLALDGIALDEIVLEISRSNALYLKIDVEGFGGEVIRGALNTISKFKPNILMEIHENSDERNSLASLSKLGYKFFNLDLLPENVYNNDCRFFVAKVVDTN